MVQYLDNNSGFNQWKNMQANKPKKSFGLMWWIITFLFAWWIMGVWFKPQDTIVDNQNVVNIENSSLPTRQIDAEKISFDVQGLRVSNISLKDYSKAAKDKELVSLLKDENNFVEIGFISNDSQMPNADTNWELKSGVMHYGKNVHIARSVSVDGYVIKISDTIKNNSGSCYRKRLESKFIF